MSTTAKIEASKVEHPPATLVKMAYCYRAKYRIAGLKRIAPAFMGVHPSNRNGEPVSGERCADLISQILKMGFDPNEADNNGVCVQDAPGKLTIHNFNVKVCAGDEKMCATLNDATMQYGSLSHSHLSQGMKNIMGECCLGISALCRGDSNTANVEVLAELDSEFARYCNSGLLWEVLSHKIEEEEPDALNIIQAACNCKNGIALRSHETEALSGLARLVLKASALAEQLAFESARDKLALTLPHLALDPEFMGMFRFVLELGGDSCRFIPDLREFTSKFINAKAEFNYLIKL